MRPLPSSERLASAGAAAPPTNANASSSSALNSPPLRCSVGLLAVTLTLVVWALIIACGSIMAVFSAYSMESAQDSAFRMSSMVATSCAEDVRRTLSSAAGIADSFQYRVYNGIDSSASGCSSSSSGFGIGSAQKTDSLRANNSSSSSNPRRCPISQLPIEVFEEEEGREESGASTNSPYSPTFFDSHWYTVYEASMVSYLKGDDSSPPITIDGDVTTVAPAGTAKSASAEVLAASPSAVRQLSFGFVDYGNVACILSSGDNILCTRADPNRLSAAAMEEAQMANVNYTLYSPTGTFLRRGVYPLHYNVRSRRWYRIVVEKGMLATREPTTTVLVTRPPWFPTFGGPTPAPPVPPTTAAPTFANGLPLWSIPSYYKIWGGFTAPSSEFQTGTTLSFSLVNSSGYFLGVGKVNVELGELSNRLKFLEATANTVVLILNADNRVVASSSLGEGQKPYAFSDPSPEELAMEGSEDPHCDIADYTTFLNNVSLTTTVKKRACLLDIDGLGYAPLKALASKCGDALRCSDTDGDASGGFQYSSNFFSSSWIYSTNASSSYPSSLVSSRYSLGGDVGAYWITSLPILPDKATHLGWKLFVFVPEKDLTDRFLRQLKIAIGISVAIVVFVVIIIAVLARRVLMPLSFVADEMGRMSYLDPRHDDDYREGEAATTATGDRTVDRRRNKQRDHREWSDPEEDANGSFHFHHHRVPARALPASIRSSRAKASAAAAIPAPTAPTFSFAYSRLAEVAAIQHAYWCMSDELRLLRGYIPQHVCREVVATVRRGRGDRRGDVDDGDANGNSKGLFSPLFEWWRKGSSGDVAADTTAIRRMKKKKKTAASPTTNARSFEAHDHHNNGYADYEDVEGPIEMEEYPLADDGPPAANSGGGGGAADAPFTSDAGDGAAFVAGGGGCAASDCHRHEGLLLPALASHCDDEGTTNGAAMHCNVLRDEANYMYDDAVAVAADGAAGVVDCDDEVAAAATAGALVSLVNRSSSSSIAASSATCRPHLKPQPHLPQQQSTVAAVETTTVIVVPGPQEVEGGAGAKKKTAGDADDADESVSDVTMDGVDGVGDHFPLTIAAQVVTAAPQPHLHHPHLHVAGAGAGAAVASSHKNNTSSHTVNTPLAFAKSYTTHQNTAHHTAAVAPQRRSTTTALATTANVAAGVVVVVNPPPSDSAAAAAAGVVVTAGSQSQLQSPLSHRVPSFFSSPISPSSSSILYADSALIDREISVAVVNIIGFHQYALVTHGADVTRHFEAMVSYLCKTAEKCGGMLDTFSGDKFWISFNATSRCDDHPIAAACFGLEVSSFINKEAAIARKAQLIERYTQETEGKGNSGSCCGGGGGGGCGGETTAAVPIHHDHHTAPSSTNPLRHPPTTTLHHNQNKRNTTGGGGGIGSSVVNNPDDEEAMQRRRRFSPTFRCALMGVTVGAATGRAFVGPLGTSTIRRHTIISDAMTEAAALERLCSHYNKHLFLAPPEDNDDDAAGGGDANGQQQTNPAGDQPLKSKSSSPSLQLQRLIASSEYYYGYHNACPLLVGGEAMLAAIEGYMQFLVIDAVALPEGTQRRSAAAAAAAGGGAGAAYQRHRQRSQLNPQRGGGGGEGRRRLYHNNNSNRQRIAAVLAPMCAVDAGCKTHHLRGLDYALRRRGRREASVSAATSYAAAVVTVSPVGNVDNEYHQYQPQSPPTDSQNGASPHFSHPSIPPLVTSSSSSSLLPAGADEYEEEHLSSSFLSSSSPIAATTRTALLRLLPTANPFAAVNDLFTAFLLGRQDDCFHLMRIVDNDVFVSEGGARGPYPSTPEPPYYFSFSGSVVVAKEEKEARMKRSSGAAAGGGATPSPKKNTSGGGGTEGGKGGEESARRRPPPTPYGPHSGDLLLRTPIPLAPLERRLIKSVLHRVWQMMANVPTPVDGTTYVSRVGEFFCPPPPPPPPSQALASL